MIPFLFDTHAHLNFKAYEINRWQIIDACLKDNIWLINVGSQFDTSQKAVEIANFYEQGIYVAIGLHPIHLFASLIDEEEVNFNARDERFVASQYQSLIDNSHGRVVAIGEIGLDYYHLSSDSAIQKITDKALQREQFLMQIKFAAKNNLPLIIHCRGSRDNPVDAYSDLYDILIANKNFLLADHPGVMHCFGGNLDYAQKFTNMGFYLGFTGIITFGKKSEELCSVVQNISLEKILAETDCPYLSPDPYRGQTNEPARVELVIKKIAQLKNIEFSEAAAMTTANALKLFRLNPSG